jgi:lipopolysaccharide/colanic/teichoic acid biosynthesis glycosyltransferase
VVEQLEVHGVTVERIVVVQPMKKLSLNARNALLALERNSEIRVDWLLERLGFDESANVENPDRSPGLEGGKTVVKFSPKRAATTLGRYGYVKRALDLTGAILSGLLLAPVILLVGLIVAVDLGLPILFWQQRPGRWGRPFKLYKFCTMRAAHNLDGKRIPDLQRSSLVGHLLRRTRLDELPQLYNILVGEMSFVGPRPLLPWDQPDDVTGRLSVRPGLTGLAQVYGDRNMLPDDKNALDIWYIRSASLWLDFKILLRTLVVMIRGERIDHHTLRIARGKLEQSENSAAANVLCTVSHSPPSEVVPSAG